MQKIQEVEALCAKEYAQVSHYWESLMDDEELEQVTDKIHTMEENISGLSNSLKTLSSIEKMRKFVDLKTLQQ